jgi:hypothetical protein
MWSPGHRTIAIRDGVRELILDGGGVREKAPYAAIRPAMGLFVACG